MSMMLNEEAMKAMQHLKPDAVGQGAYNDKTQVSLGELRGLMLAFMPSLGALTVENFLEQVYAKRMANTHLCTYPKWNGRLWSVVARLEPEYLRYFLGQEAWVAKNPELADHLRQLLA
jgi:hypothetical protein